MIETIAGTRAIGHRLAHGEMAFEAQLVEIAHVTDDDAYKMRLWMKKKKLTTRDFCSGRISVKHGAYLDRDVLLRIRDEIRK